MKTRSLLVFLVVGLAIGLLATFAPASAEELYYDSGTPYGGTGGAEGYTLVVRFTVSDPVSVTAVKFMHGPTDGYDLGVHIWNQSLEEVYYSEYTGASSPSAAWTTITLPSNSPSLSGDFYVGLELINGYDVGIMQDNNGVVGRSYTSFSDNPTQSPYTYGDLMIRAIVESQDTNNPPDCSAVVPSVETMWPPNHKMVEVEILGVTDPDGDPVEIEITGVMQDEPLEGNDEGAFEPDAVIDGDKVQLRAERADLGDGRVYHVYFTATDDKGAACNGEVWVGVPLDKKGEPYDDGALYDSTGSI